MTLILVLIMTDILELLKRILVFITSILVLMKRILVIIMTL